jgi:hypothetical protein
MRTVKILANHLFPVILITVLGVVLFGGQDGNKPKVLIVMDERQQMEVLADYMQQKNGVKSTIVDQASLPADFSDYDAVIGYIHKALEEKTELAIIDYVKKGGRFIAVHHMISSKKSLNKFYFDFLGLHLDFEDNKAPSTHDGPYAWRHPVELQIVNINPAHFITSNDMSWPDEVSYKSSDTPSVERKFQAFTIDEAEFYLNHKFTDGRAKTVLLGFKCFDDRNSTTFMQDRAAWIKPAGEGEIIYFKMGHSAETIGKQEVSQLVLNAVLWQR